jgi:hypothetical protein
MGVTKAVDEITVVRVIMPRMIVFARSGSDEPLGRKEAFSNNLRVRDPIIKRRKSA